ncbi:hypothetical protein AMJ85_05900 [candidate division BRC1 bacterium SM23_51]|nr:MAG: hypothetical protein AMJ85_05900 [candidate division BRC1 bacterium SM23_51]
MQRNKRLEVGGEKQEKASRSPEVTSRLGDWRVCEKILALFLFRPFRARTWEDPVYPGRRPPCGGLALGYVLTPFQGFNWTSHTRS